MRARGLGRSLLVVVAMTVTACGDDDSVTAGDQRSTSTTVDTPTTSSTATSLSTSSTTTTTSTAPTTTTTTTTAAVEAEPPLVGAASPVDAVVGYVAALADADYAGGWSLLHPRSRDSFPGGWEAFDGETGLVEGTGALAAISVDRYQSATVAAAHDGGAVAAVSLWGQVEQEGSSVFDVFAFGCREIDGLWFVELVSAPGFAWVSPPNRGATIEPADGVRATYAPGAAVLEVVAAVAGTERPVTVDEDPDDPEAAVIEVDGFDTGSQQAVIGLLLTSGDLVVGATHFSV